MKSDIKLFKKILISSCLIIFLILTGCDAEKSNQDKISEVEKVSKKISIPQKIAKEDAGNTDKAENVIVEKKENENSEEKNKVFLDKNIINDLIINPQDSLKKEEKAVAAGSLYSPEGRVDPFNPLIKKAEKKEDSVQKKGDKPRRPKTPLEKLDLSQLKLVAILESPDGKIAVLEESTGKGYIVDKGTYVGLNSGQITSIGADQIIITETVENISGKSVKRERLLKIQKPVGE